MKKAKWAAVILAIPVACIGLLWVDTYYRAVAAIKAEDERLARDIAAYRAGRKPGMKVEWERFLQRHRLIACPLSVYMGMERAQVDQGHSGTRKFYSKLLTETYLQVPSRPLWGDVDPSPRIDQVLTALSVTHQVAQECGYDSRSLLFGFEIFAVRGLEYILKAGLPAPELRRLAEQLDRTLEARPSFADAFDAEHLMDRAEVLRVLHLKENASGFIRRKPGWREFFSWRILLVKCLKELDEEYSSKLQSEFRDRLTTSALLREWDVRDREDNEVLCWWTLARTATAIALYRAERGEPDRLEDLVPSYLPRVAQGLTLLNGNLSIPLTQDQVCTWDVRRK